MWVEAGGRRFLLPDLVQAVPVSQSWLPSLAELCLKTVYSMTAGSVQLSVSSSPTSPTHLPALSRQQQPTTTTHHNANPMKHADNPVTVG